MTPTQFQNAIDKLDLSQLGTARLIATNPRTVRRWVSGIARVPESVAIILRLLTAGKITVQDVIDTNPKHLSE